MLAGSVVLVFLLVCGAVRAQDEEEETVWDHVVEMFAPGMISRIFPLLPFIFHEYYSTFSVN